MQPESFIFTVLEGKKVHNNYFFIRRLAVSLRLLEGSKVVECFSQQKEELILVFDKEGKEHFIQAHFESTFSSLFFPQDFRRARQNSINLFQEIIDLSVLSVKAALNERCILLSLEGGLTLVFKLYGTRANVILFQGDSVLKIFKNNLKLDLELSLAALNRNLDLSKEHFFELEGAINSYLPTLGKEASNWLLQHNYAQLSLEEKWSLMGELMKHLEAPKYSIIYDDKGRLALSILPEERVKEVFNDPVSALNTFFRLYIRDFHIYHLKEQLFRDLERRIKHSKAVIDDSEKRLKEIENSIPMDQTADVIMANLHAIKQGSEKAVLFDFYRDKEREIKLNSKLSPQKYAEVLYKKAKSKFKEIEVLENAVIQRSELVDNLLADIETVRKLDDPKELKSYQIKYFKQQETEREINEGPFKTYQFMGFKIFVGKSAKANDELTFRTAKKDDLWLHAKDVAGSHVIIQQRPGQNFPVPVIEKAASLAAFYSKRKTDSLCPVMYTQKKFVRKIKGAAPGMVKVEKENVVMVVPSNME